MAQNFYQILGVPYRATQAEIKSAYKKLALKYHPDRNQNSPFHEEHFKKVAEAYRTLHDEYSRQVYDLKLFGSASTGGASTASGPAWANPYGKSTSGSGRPYGTGPSRPAARKPKASKFDKKLEHRYRRQALLIIGGFFLLLFALSYYGGRYSDSYHRAELLTRQGQWALAILENDRYAPAYYQRGLAYQQEGKLEKALEDFETAIAHQERPTLAFYLASGRLMATLGQHQTAASRLGTAARISENKMPELLLEKGMAELNGGLYEDAVNSLGRYNSVVGSQPEGLLAEAMAWMGMGNARGAQNTLALLLEEHPQHARGHLYMAMLLHQLQQPQKACVHAQLSAQLGEPRADSLRHLYCP